MPSERKMVLFKKKPFWFIIAGQSCSAFGDVFQLVAVTVLLYNLTGSGLSAAFGVICTPLTSLILSPFAGSLGDRLNERRILIVIDVLRALITLLLAGRSSVVEIYIILVIQAALGNIYAPPFKKLLAGILENKEMIPANSILTGISGIVYIVGPITASWFINSYRLDLSFYINSFSFLFSALMIFLIKENSHKQPKTQKVPTLKTGLISDIHKGIAYFKKDYNLKSLVLASTIICFGTAAVNMIFYPFVFNELKVSNEQWSFMLSVFYGTNLAAMLLSNPFLKLFRHIRGAICSIFLMVSAVWFLYSTSDSVTFVVILQGIEGTLLAVCSILLNSFIQIYSEKNYLSRVMSINDYLSNSGKLAGIGISMFVLKIAGVRISLLLNSLLLFLGTIIILCSNMSKVYIKSRKKV